MAMLIPNTNYESQPNTEFINRFIGMKCAVDLLRMKMFPNAKEVTESVGAYAACDHLPSVFSRTNTDVNMVAVGDGHKPRTAALFAHLSRWNCISVDPELRDTVYPINRFKAYRARIENLELKLSGPTVIVCVHSHAKLSSCLKSISGDDLHIINMPCCIKPDIELRPHLSYNDVRIWSPKNLIEVYKVGVTEPCS